MNPKVHYRVTRARHWSLSWARLIHEWECGDGLQTEDQKGNTDGHFVWEPQKRTPKVSYRPIKAKGKKDLCKASVTS
jgi:hypothetical protein